MINFDKFWRAAELMFAMQDHRDSLYIGAQDREALHHLGVNIDDDAFITFMINSYGKGKVSKIPASISYVDLKYREPDKTTFTPLQDVDYTNWLKKYKIHRHCFRTEANTGGADGGNCWDGIASRYDTHNTAECPLKEFLIKYDIDMSFTKYAKLSSSIVKKLSYSVNEYYGNYTDYEVKYFYVDELFKGLK